MAISTDVEARNSRQGKHSAGLGMYLHVTAAGRYWRMKYRFAGKEKLLALGVYPAVSLAAARKARDKARDLLDKGIDPSAARREEKRALAAAQANSFEAVALEYHRQRADDWSAGHAKKWLWHLEKNAFPEFGRMPVAAITAPVVLDMLRKVERSGRIYTAHKLLQIVGEVIRYAMRTGRRDDDPTTALRGGALKTYRAKHMPAITEPGRLGDLMRAIYAYGGQPATVAALKLSALLFQRPGNIRLMQWDWVDLDGAMITVPSMDMKRRVHEKVNGRPHLIPLAPQAVEILRGLHPLTGQGQYVFQGLTDHDKPLSENTVNKAMRSMGFDKAEVTGHGFRSTARTLIAERLPGIPIDVIERQLAHKTRDPLGESYDRAQYLEQRKAMMREWASYLDRLRIGADVLQFPAAKQA